MFVFCLHGKELRHYWHGIIEHMVEFIVCTKLSDVLVTDLWGPTKDEQSAMHAGDVIMIKYLLV
jgi:hypothetical protein